MTIGWRWLALVLVVSAPSAGCDDDEGAVSGADAEGADAGFVDAKSEDASGFDASTSDADPIDAFAPDADSVDSGEIDSGRPLQVDRTDPQLRSFEFTAAEADPLATRYLGTELAYLDTRVEPRGKLVVYLHGAGLPATCGSRAHEELLAGLGFHVIGPCYASDYGVGNCGADIGGCRLEAFEGVDHTPVIDIGPPESIETRVVKMLEHLAVEFPGGDWTYYLENDQPRWDQIIISGISHGASSAGVIAIHRRVDRAVMLSGPLDSDQAWLELTSLTPIDRFYGFTHTADVQHPGHLEAFETLGVLGAPISVDDAAPPYGDSHRLITSAPTTDGHGSTQAGGSSPMMDGAFLFAPVWTFMYLE